MDSYVGVKAVLDKPGLVIEKSVTLRSGLKFPVIGLGTYKIKGRDAVETSVDAALAAGYRAFDSAYVYGNEVDLGNAFKSLLPKYHLQRHDIAITTKLSPSHHGEEAQQSVEESIKRLGVDYIDVYLIHWPGVSGVHVTDEKQKALRIQSWLEMERCVKKGLIKSIGVSNYTAKHLQELLQVATICPDINQVEFHPFYQQPDDLYEICQRESILLQAYSSFGGTGNRSLLEEPLIVEIAGKYKRTPAQILLRWTLQSGYAIIPKSVRPHIIKENIELDFKLDEVVYQRIKSSITTVQKFAWEPLTVA